MKTFTSYISESSHKTYVNMIVLYDNKEILILKRANYMKKFRGLWGFPGGSLDDKDKNGKDGAMRELKEETGIELTWNEEHSCKKLKSITNQDGSISEYYMVELETKPEIHISKEHSKYEWINKSEYKNDHKWMPDVFQLIQTLL